MNEQRKSPSPPFPYARMLGKRDALDRLDMRFRWGGYGIRVLKCHLMVFSPGQIISFHKHSEYEFHFIPKGKGKVILQDQLFDLDEGMFYLTGPDVMHYQESDPADPMHELCLHCEILPVSAERTGADEFGDELERREAEECVASLDRLPKEPLRDLYHAMGCFLDAYRTWEEQPSGFYTLMKQAIIGILLRSARLNPSKGHASVIPIRNMNGYRFEMASQYIRINKGLPITLEDVAGRLGVSSRQLQRIFRSEGGTTFREFVEHVRLSAVCAELAGTDKPVEDIALEQGFATPNYLFPVFKQKFGITPAAYRRIHGRNARR